MQQAICPATVLKKVICFFSCLLLVKCSFSQNATTGITAIDQAVTDKNYALAEKLWQQDVARFTEAGNVDTLPDYIIWAGKIEAKKTGDLQAIERVKRFVEKIKTQTKTGIIISQAYVEAAEFYGLLSKNQLAYITLQQALPYTSTAPGKPLTQLITIESNMATYAQRMGDLSLSILHGRQALKWLQSAPQTNHEKLYLVYSAMGTGMYYISKQDSAIYFYNKAITELSQATPTIDNKYYRPAIIQNNLSGIYGVQGRTTEAIAAEKSCIRNLKLFLTSKEPSAKKEGAIDFQFEATDNLAGIYKELGDYKQAKELLTYSYQQKQKLLPPGNPDVFISEILLGQLYYAMRDYTQSQQFLNHGLQLLSKADGDYLYWQADACNTLALLHEAKKENRQASLFYEKADSLYEESLQGEYDNIYLDFLTNASTFYAANGQAQKAISKANKGYEYIAKTQGAQTLAASYQLGNLAEVYYLSGQYPQALAFGNKALAAINNSIRNSDNLLDSVKAELKKPKVTLSTAKAKYQLLPVKNIANLSAIATELEAALALLERRKAVIGNTEDAGLLVADHEELLQFIKQINYDLFRLTKNNIYIDKLVGLHESGLYNRIRSRLDAADSLQFIDVPKAAQATDQKLQAAITAALEGNATHNNNMVAYFKAVSNWNNYQKDLQVKYPRYYKMRYGSIFKSLGDIQKAVPTGTSVIRYFFIDDSLYALVADTKSKQVFALQSNELKEKITALQFNSMDAGKTGSLLYGLYQQLWAPFASSIRNKKIIIIPDGILYNLSFEILTPQKINSFSELASKTLLTNYAISYQYSLFLLEPAAGKINPSNNFVAFAPGFTEEIKTKYKTGIKNGDETDNSYLSLLPQPFTIALATRMQKLFGGKVYLNDESTAANFKANAGHHTIIHIGTHAESDNLHPEYSRLIFAKNTVATDENNSVFLPDLYNCDLSSDLTVLTACESGRPGYQDGEGMISLAHAFNYAGSQSILTGLWKIDEQVSMQIMDEFYKNLSAGMPKDEALRQAKLWYLNNNSGRVLAPQYWAGLVLMGNTAPLQLEQKKLATYYWIAGGVLLALLTLIYFKRKVAVNTQSHR